MGIKVIFLDVASKNITLYPEILLIYGRTEVRNMTGIYKITNKINGKAYIGQSYDIFARWKQHRNTTTTQSNGLLYKAFEKYGIENFEFTILEELEYVQDLLNEREKYWISFYHTYVDDPCGPGYNLTLGGEGMQIINHQQVIDYWNEGKSLREISDIMGHSQSTLRQHVIECVDYNEEEARRRGNLYQWQDRGQCVEQYTIKGEYLNTFYNMHEAERQTGVSSKNIWQAVSKSSYSAGGYQWKYAHDLTPISDITSKTRKYKQVVLRIDKDGNVVEYESASEAERQNKISSIQIRRVCQGKGKTAGGYKWQYKE